MRRLLWQLGISAIAAAVLSVVLSFSGAAVLTEAAIHRIRTAGPGDSAETARSAGLATEAWTTAPDGTRLHAWWIKPSGWSGRAVMVCHGVGDSSRGAIGYAPMLLAHGYAVLAPDSRGHGESGGMVTYGLLESGDAMLWLQWTKAHGARADFGLGESLGAAILLQSLSRGAHFRAVVAESSYASFPQVARDRVADMLGTGPIASAAAAVLVGEGLLWARWHYGLNLADASPERSMAGSVAPVLLIHGTRDDRTRPEHSLRIHQANPDHTRLWLVPGAGHVGAYAAERNLFEEKVAGWFDTFR